MTSYGGSRHTIGSRRAILQPVDAGVNIRVPVVNATAEAFSPNRGIYIPVVSASGSLFSPGVSTGATIAPPALAAMANTNAPGVSGGAVIAPPALVATASANVPRLASGISVNIPVKSASAHEFAPVILTGVNIAVPVKSAAANDNPPIISAGANVAVPSTSATAQANVPAISIYGVGIPNFAVNAAIYAPDIAGGANPQIPVSTGYAVALAPGVSAGASIDAPNLAATASTNAPSVSGGASVTVPNLAVTAASSAPSVTAAAGLTLSYYGAVAANNTTSLTIPSGASVGDLAVVLTFDPSGSNHTVPSGWTQLIRWNSSQDAAWYYKVLESGDLGASLNLGNSNTYGLLMVFSASQPITTVTAGTVNFQITNGTPSNQTVAASGGTAPLVVLAYAGYSSGLGTFSVQTPALDGTETNDRVTGGYKIYNASPANQTVGKADQGSGNLLASTYLACA